MPQYKKKDIQRLQKLAETGNAAAQCELATCYFTGNGVKKDFTEAFEWYQVAAQQGSAEGMGALGICYENGSGVEQSDERAATWYRKAAEAGNPRAQRDLGRMYAYGKGVPADAASARYWYSAAASQGETDAMVDLGDLCLSGQGGPKDPGQAETWYRKALAAGDRTAAARISLVALEKRSSAGEADAQYEYALRSKDLSQDDESKRARSEELTRASAEGGFAPAQCDMGEKLYAKGQDDKAVEMFEKAAAQNHPRGTFMLGVCHGTGRGVKKDPAKAAELIGKAAEMGDADACRVYARCLAVGRGVPADVDGAEKWLSKSLELGSKKGLVDLGCCSELKGDAESARKYYTVAAGNGDAVAGWRLEFLDLQAEGADDPESIRRLADGIRFAPVMLAGGSGAVGLYRRAANAGDAKAMVDMGICCRCGIGIPRDDEEAFGWFSKAAEAGDVYGKYLAGLCCGFGCGTALDQAKGAELRKGLLPQISGKYDAMIGMVCDGIDPGNLYGPETAAAAESFYSRAGLRLGDVVRKPADIDPVRDLVLPSPDPERVQDGGEPPP